MNILYNSSCFSLRSLQAAGVIKNYIIRSSFLTVYNQIRNEALLVIVKEENNITNHEKYKGQFLG